MQNLNLSKQASKQASKAKPLFKLSQLFVGLFIVSPLAIAETNAVLDDVNVTTASDSTSTEHTKSYTTSAMKTTTGLELTPKETPQSVSVITKAQLNDQGITKMEDALKNTTGINVVREGNRYRYLSRGFFIDQIEEDGISSTVPGSAMNTYADAQSMTDLSVYDHIEVVRGATGLTQANGSPGGTINAVRKRPTVETKAQGDFTFDRFGKARTSADISGSLNEAKTVRGRFMSTLEHDPTFQDKKNSLGVVYGVVEADLNDSSRLTFGALYQHKKERPDPAGLVMGTNGEDLYLPYDTLLTANWSNATYKKTNVFTEFDYFFNDSWKLNLKASYTDNRSDEEFATLASRNSKKGDTNEIVRQGILSRYNNKGSEVALRANLTGKYHLFSQEHDLFLNYAYTREKGRSHNVDAVRDTTATYNIYQFTGNIPYPDWSTFSWNGVSNNLFVTHSVYGGTRINPTKSLHILAAGNYSWFRSEYFENALRANGTTYSEETITSQSHFTPYLGITWDIDEHNSLYASYTSIFKPSYGRKDKNGKLIDPKTGNNYELGWKSEWFDGALNTSLALFQLDEKNRPISISRTQAQLEDPTATSGYSIAGGRARSRGWEAEISGKLTENWNLFLGYTYNFSKYVVSESTSYPAGMNFSSYTPKHMLRLYTNYRLPFDDGKWTIGAGVTAQSNTKSLNNIEQGGYAIWNANIQYDVTKNISLHLIGSNLTDKRYYQNQRTRNNVAGNYYGEPRNVAFQLNWKF